MVRYMRELIIVFLLLVCGEEVVNATKPTIRIDEKNANVMAMNYWRDVDKTDNLIENNEDRIDSLFVDFLAILQNVSDKEKAFAAMWENGAGKTEILESLIHLNSKYLGEMQSPFYDEELYIKELNYLLAYPKVKIEDKERLQYELNIALKNRVGHKAANFSFVKKDGRRGTLYTVKSDYILLYFNNPTCDVCVQTKEALAAMKVLEQKRVKVLAVAVDASKEEWQGLDMPMTWIDARDEKNLIANRELYDLPSLPILYLLDSNHRVVLKNTKIEQIEDYFERKK